MTKGPHVETYEMGDLDWYAIKIVVREGKRMALSRPEKIVAAKLMRQKGYYADEVAERLGIDNKLVIKFWKIPSPVPLDDIDPVVVGGSVGFDNPFTKAYVRQMGGRV